MKDGTRMSWDVAWRPRVTVQRWCPTEARWHRRLQMPVFRL